VSAVLLGIRTRAPALVERGPTSFGQRLSECFERAAAAHLERRELQVGGRRICLEFAGNALTEDLTKFLAPAKLGHEAPSLRIKVWDTESTGVEPPPAPPALFTRAPEIERQGQRFAFSAVSSTLQFYDERTSTAHYWVRKPSRVACWERAAPFRTSLAWWAESSGAALVHAAVVGSAERGVLLAGSSGAGKSTTALACLASGLAFLSDDCAMLRIEAGAPTAYGLYRTAKVDATSLGARLHTLSTLDTSLVHDRGKSILALPRQDPRLLLRSDICAVITQTVARDGKTRMRSETPARALQALAPSTLLQTPGVGQRTLDILATLVASVPCYALESGDDLARVTDCVRELVR
jgi:hypothetical protein